MLKCVINKKRFCIQNLNCKWPRSLQYFVPACFITFNGKGITATPPGGFLLKLDCIKQLNISTCPTTVHGAITTMSLC